MQRPARKEYSRRFSVVRGLFASTRCLFALGSTRCLFALGSTRCLFALGSTRGLFALASTRGLFALGASTVSSLLMVLVTSTAYGEGNSTLATASTGAATKGAKVKSALKGTPHSPSTAFEITIDAVVASVNAKPITFLEVLNRIPEEKALTLKEAAQNQKFRAALDAMILERLILEEAEVKKFSVSPQEIEHYIDEIAARNNLSRAAFEQALVGEGRTLESFTQQVKIEVLKGKIAGSLLRQGTVVSDEEVSSYLSAHDELSSSGNKVRLRHVLLGKPKHSAAESKDLLQKIRTRLEAGESFEELAKNTSESRDAAEGGSLGLLNEQELGSEIRAALTNLTPGQLSEIVETDAGWHLFKLEERLQADEPAGKDAMRTQVRNRLQQQKLESKLENYFTNDLYKSFAVDKKI